MFWLRNKIITFSVRTCFSTALHRRIGLNSKLVFYLRIQDNYQFNEKRLIFFYVFKSDMFTLDLFQLPLTLRFVRPGHLLRTLFMRGDVSSN